MKAIKTYVPIMLALFCCTALEPARSCASADLTGIWNTTDSCLPDTPYTMLFDQSDSSISIASTASDTWSCNGTLSGSSLALTCSSSGHAFSLGGTVIDNASMTLAYQPDNGSESTCALTKQDGLDPMVAAMLKLTNLSERIKPLGERTPAQMRRYVRRMNIALAFFPAARVAQVRTVRIPGPGGKLPVRLYTPEGQGPFPVIVFYHGGGWVLGTLNMFDHYCKALAKESSAIVASVDYRLAPEHVFPSALDDAYAALLWVSEHAAEFNGDAARLAVAGESAGGNLAAVVCMLARDRRGPAIRYQVLMSPVINVSEMNTQSYSDFATGYFLTKEWMEAFRGFYLPDSADWTNPLVSPLLADNVSNLPPALIITAAYDVLRDEGEAYARKLASTGVAAKNYRCGGVIHGFTTTMIDFLPQTKDMVRLTAQELAAAFH